MDNRTRKIIITLLVVSIILITLGTILNSIEVDRLNNKITKQKGIIQELKAKNEQLKDDYKELDNKYFYEKLQAEYWYYYNVTDAC